MRAFCSITGHAEPEVFHTNEGHAGFLGLERIREYVSAGLSLDEAIELSRAGHRVHDPHPGARGHRPVPARASSGGTSVRRGRDLPVDRVLAFGAES